MRLQQLSPEDADECYKAHCCPCDVGTIHTPDVHEHPFSNEATALCSDAVKAPIINPVLGVHVLMSDAQGLGSLKKSLNHMGRSGLEGGLCDL